MSEGIGREIPQGWSWVALNEVAHHHSGNSKIIKGTLPGSPSEGLFPAFSATGQDVWRDEFEHEGPAIIISAVGARCGKCFKASGKWSAIANTHVVWPSTSVADRDFLWFKLNNEHFWVKGGSAQPFVKTRESFEHRFPLPPLNEQRRIVEKIETLFARLDQGEAALRHTQQLLARYRQSVLKAAVTGALTADWRAQNAHRLEHGRDLLARILQTRRETWQGRGKYQEPAAPDTSNLTELPEGWVWASVDQLSSSAPNSLCIGPFGSNLKVEDYRDTGVPLVFVRHIRAKNFEGQNSRFVTEEKAFELSSHRVFPGDLLITKMGDPPGDVCIYPENSPVAIITADCIRFAASTVGVSRDYLAGAIESRIVQAQIHALSKGVAQQKVTLAGFKRVAIPLPSTLEQNLSATVIEAEFRKAIELAAHVQTELTRSAALRQSILKDAFAGKLVPQDPTDEPAAELLARIRASRTAMPRNKARA
ncbi:MAG: hypothetical protein AMXMBFR76_03820 [Pseudomonadota bacterium]